MAAIALLSPDLLFGSKVQGALELAGHAVERFEAVEPLRASARRHALLILDLTAEGIDGPALVRSMREQGELGPLPTLAYYAHVDAEMRDRALAAGITRVVPRSRMARECVELVEGLLAPGERTRE